MYQIEAPFYFYLLGIIPVVTLIYILVVIWKKRTINRFGSIDIVNKLSPQRSTFKPFFKFILFCIILILLIIGLANPQMGKELQTVKREGLDIVFVVDVSKSMLAEDVAPNRLEKSKRLISAIIDNLVSDRIGIVAYAQKAIPLLPITSDYNAAKMFLQDVNTDMLSSQGTAIDAAIDLSSTFFNTEEETNKLIFLLSDGEDHSNQVLKSISKANDLGISIFTLGIGTEKGAPIPIKRNGKIVNYKKDNRGNTVITKKSRDILEKIASKGKGEYLEGNDTEKVLAFIEDLLKKIDKKEFEAKKYVSYKSHFQLFLIIAFILLFLDCFIFETKTKWIQKLNLFNETK